MGQLQVGKMATYTMDRHNSIPGVGAIHCLTPGSISALQPTYPHRHYAQGIFSLHLMLWKYDTGCVCSTSAVEMWEEYLQRSVKTCHFHKCSKEILMKSEMIVVCILLQIFFAKQNCFME
jgi:hypothetical protein